MTVVRTAAVGALVVSCTACTSFAETAECGAPPLVAMSGAASAPLTTGPTIELWEADGGSQVLTDDRAASWPAMSPDGDTVAIALGEGEWSDQGGWQSSRVALLSVDTAEVTMLSAEVEGSQVAHLQWSTSGAEIAFLRFGPEGREIVAVEAATGEERRLLPLTDGQGDFAWSPDATEMIVPTRVEAGVELRRYFLGSGHHVVVITEEIGIRRPAWSPDGRWIALQTFVPGTTRLRLFVLDIETGERVPVDLRRGGPGPVTWSGPFLLYLYEIGGPASDIALMSWNSRTLRRAPIERGDLDRFVQGSISAARCDAAAV